MPQTKIRLINDSFEDIFLKLWYRYEDESDLKYGTRVFAEQEASAKAMADGERMAREEEEERKRLAKEARMEAARRPKAPVKPRKPRVVKAKQAVPLRK